jgi:ergothioneine biosynthesis protein EgtB
MNWDQCISEFNNTRSATEKICSKLEIEDYNLQTHSQVSPPKWHLAHTTWFFENFILKKFAAKRCSPEFYDIAFNSYYKSQGEHCLQEHRHHLARPTVKEVYQYRKDLNNEIRKINFNSLNEDQQKDFLSFMQIGIHHEQQHQELLFMDICFNNSKQLAPQNLLPNQNLNLRETELNFVNIEGGIHEFGHSFSADKFCYDNETPKHQVYVNDFSIANRPITNAEFISFIEAGGFTKPDYWLSDAWSALEKKEDKLPLYWKKDGNKYLEFHNNQWQEVQDHKPLQNISYYEAYAIAKFMGARLPTEYEWELASRKSSLKQENFFDPTNNQLGLVDVETDELCLFHGGLWEWTESAYTPFPRYQQDKGALGEYNGKFMCNQKVLKGGCFATAFTHYRPSYRNFFYPDQSWAFTGLRLAKDF